MSHSRKSKGLKYWEDKISQWKESNLSGNQFCIQNNINQAVFHRWKRKLTDPTTDHKQSLIELPLSVTAQSSDPVIVFYYQSIRIEITHDFSESTLVKLLRVLKGK